MKLLLVYGNKVNALIESAGDLSAAIKPEGSRDEAINELLGLVDGPEQWETQAGCNAAASAANNARHL